MSSDPDCDPATNPSGGAHECPLRAPGRTDRVTEAVSSVEDLSFRLASHAMAFTLSDDVFPRFREFVIRAEISRGSPRAAEILKEALGRNLLNEARLAFLLAVQRFDPARYGD